MKKEVRYLLEDIFHIPSIPVYKTVDSIQEGMWIIFIVQGDPDTHYDNDGNIVEKKPPVAKQQTSTDNMGTVVAQIVDHKGRKDYLYNQWVAVSYDSAVSIFGSKNKDVAESVANKIRKKISTQDRVIKLVLIDDERYDRLNEELQEKMLLRSYANEISKNKVKD